jgi:hypothetical protein
MIFLPRRMSPLLALSGHSNCTVECPLSGAKRTSFSQRITAKKGDVVMHFVLCILLVALSPSFAFAAKGTMTLSEAQLAAAKGDADAAAAITMTTDRQICLNECARRGHNKDQCANACRPGLCHPGAEQPYCIAK